MTAEYTVPDGLLGDGTWPEPALSELGRQRGGPVLVHVGNPAVRTLYGRKKWIELTGEPGGVVLDASRAWKWAIDNRRYFAEGYFDQVGVAVTPDSRIHYDLEGVDIYKNKLVVICPFSASCSGSSGGPPNKTMPIEWWEELAVGLAPAAAKAGLGILSIGGVNEPELRHTLCWRGASLRTAANAILGASVLITVETWGCVVAGGKTLGSTLILSSATPISLHRSPDMERRGVEAVVAKHPWLWSQEQIIERATRLMGD